MADTNTTNLNLIKPEIGGAEDTWGVSINSDLDALDAIFSATGTEIDVRFNSANFDDNKKAKFGTGNDLQIYHDGSDSYINGLGTGNVIIRNSTDDADILLQTDNGSGSVTTYMTLDGSAVTTFFNKNTRHTDNIRATFGSSSDLQIYHDGSNSFISETGTGNLYIQGAGTIRLRGTTTEENLIEAVENGAVSLYHDNSKKFETSAGGATLTGTLIADGLVLGDNETAYFGTDLDLRILHTGSAGQINNTVGDLLLDVAGYIKLDSDGGFILFEDGGTQFGYIENSSTDLVLGVNTQDKDIIFKGNDGGSTINALKLDMSNNGRAIFNAGAGFSDHVNFDDNAKAVFGGGDDLQIFHDGSNSFIQDAGTGDLEIKGENNVRIKTNTGGENMAAFTANGAVSLFHNNSEKFATTSTGVDVTGVILSANNNTDDTNKEGHFLARQYDSGTETEGFQILQYFSNSSENRVDLGGASSAYNAATSVSFYTAANTTTRTGTERARIDSSGRLLLNSTSTSFNDFLYVNGDAYTTGGWRVGSSATYVGKMYNNSGKLSLEADGSRDIQFGNSTNSDILYIDTSAQNIGIGTTSVGTKLHVVSGTDNNIATDVSEIRFIGADKPITGEQANVVIQTNDDMAADKGGSIGFGGRHTTSSTNGSNFAHISGRKENSTSANFAGYLSFGTADSASDIHERMRIDSSGNIGIGTSSPSEKLEVAGKIKTGGQVRAGSYLEGFPSFSFANDTDTGMFSDTDNQLEFSTGGSSRLSIDSSGNIGIGTTSPNVDLHIVHAGSAGLKLETDGDNDANFIQFITSSSSSQGYIGNESSSAGTNFTGTLARAFVLGSTASGTATQLISAGTVKTTIDSSGNVGIGTTSPAHLLELVRSSTDFGATLEINNTSSANGSVSAVRYVTENETTGLMIGKHSNGFTGGADLAFINQELNSDLTISTNNTERLRIDASGNVGIGASPNANYRNDGSATEKYLQVGAAAVLFADSGITTALANNCAINNSDQRIALSGTNPGSMYEQYQGIHNFYTTDSVAAGNAQTLTARFRINQNGDLQGTDTSISSISDERIKKNIADYTDGLNLIKNLKPRTFEFKDTTGIRKTGTQRGFIAQEVLEHDTYWISEEDATDIKDGEYEYTKDTEKRYLSKLNDKDAMYVSAIQEQQKLIEDLQTQLNKLKR